MSDMEGSTDELKTDHEPVDHEQYAGKFIPDPWDVQARNNGEEGQDGQLDSGAVPGLSS